MKLTKDITYSDYEKGMCVVTKTIYHSQLIESENSELYKDTDWNAVIGLDIFTPEEWDSFHDYSDEDTVWRSYFVETFDDGTYIERLIEEVKESEIVKKWKEERS